MPRKIVPQNGHVVKDVLEQEECSLEWCHEPVFRAGSLCWDHFIAEATAAWNDYADEVAQAHAVSVGRG